MTLEWLNDENQQTTETTGRFAILGPTPLEGGRVVHSLYVDGEFRSRHDSLDEAKDAAETVAKA